MAICTRFYHILFILLSVVGLTACGRQAGDTARLTDGSIKYAELLELQDLTDGVSLCRISDPWRQGRVVMQYLLVPSALNWDEAESNAYEQKYGESIVIRTPMQRMAITSACHAWLLGQLGAMDQIRVMCDTAYVMAADVRNWMRGQRADGTANVIDGGASTAPNREVLLQAQCDGLWLCPYENMTAINLSQLPIPIIYCAEYMENSPLGRAEWMKLFGRLVGRNQEADSLFAAIADRYESLAQPQADSQSQTLMAELPYGATWYVPGGCSTSALLYADAGYKYAWADDTHSGSLSLSREAVLAKAQECDVWLIKYNDPLHEVWSLEDLRQQDPLYQHIRPLELGNVWACNTAISDFFDITPFRPDSLLESLKTTDGAFFRRLE